MSEALSKVCTFCKKTKITTAFRKNKYAKSGHDQPCKACDALHGAIKKCMKKCPKLLTLRIEKPRDAQQCVTCLRTKHLSAFPDRPHNKNGKAKQCLTCQEEQATMQAEKRCTRCGITKKLDQFYVDPGRSDGRTSWCAECSKEHRTNRYWANHEEEVARAFAYLVKNRDLINERKRERIRSASDAEREIRLLKSRESYARNRLKRIATSLAYIKSHPQKVRALRKRRRALIRGASQSDFTDDQWLEMQVVQDHRCYYCGKRRKGKLTQDHLTPLSKGGPHTLHNVIAVCLSCNSKKGKKQPPIPVQPLLLTIAKSKPAIRKATQPVPNANNGASVISKLADPVSAPATGA